MPEHMEDISMPKPKQGDSMFGDPRLPDILQRLRDGATLRSESTALGYKHNGVLRNALRRMIGAAEYEALMQGRRGPQHGGSAPRPSAAKPAASSSARAKA
jgi:hypothetical protein